LSKAFDGDSEDAKDRHESEHSKEGHESEHSKEGQESEHSKEGQESESSSEFLKTGKDESEVWLLFKLYIG
jgi:hypothetical protein